MFRRRYFYATPRRRFYFDALRCVRFLAVYFRAFCPLRLPLRRFFDVFIRLILLDAHAVPAPPYICCHGFCHAIYYAAARSALRPVAARYFTRAHLSRVPPITIAAATLLPDVDADCSIFPLR